MDDKEVNQEQLEESSQEVNSTPVEDQPLPPLEDPLIPPQDDEVQETPEYFGEYKPNPNVEETLPILTEGEIENVGSITLSNLELEEVATLRRLIYNRISISQQTRRKAVAEGKGGDYLSAKVGDGVIYITHKEREALNNVNAYDRSLVRGGGYKIFEEDQWTNLPTFGDHRIAIGKVDHKSSKDPILKIRGHLGLSTESNAPLWSSGMHMVLVGAGNLDQLQLSTRLLLEKSDQGLESNGFIYSASSVYMNRLVTDFILGFVSSSTAGTTDPEELKKLILLTDLETLALAAASNIYPDGYNLERPCLSSKGGCGHVVKRVTNLRRMLMVRHSRISESQFRLMTKRSGRVDVKTIRNYQESMRPEVSRYIDLDDGLKIKLKVPTLAEYERIAGAWMDRINHRSRQLISSNATEEEREIFLKRASSIAMVMAYGHWVEAIVKVSDDLDAEPEVLVTRLGSDVEDLEAQYNADIELDKLLEDFSSNEKLIDKIMKGIETFITKMTISSVAIKKVNCPKCHKPATGDELSSHPHLINVNPIELFFTLIHHKIAQAGG